MDTTSLGIVGSSNLQHYSDEGKKFFLVQTFKNEIFVPLSIIIKRHACAGCLRCDTDRHICGSRVRTQYNEYIGPLKLMKWVNGGVEKPFVSKRFR